VKSILALVGTGSTLALVGVGLLGAAAVVGLRDATGWSLWLCLLLIGVACIAAGSAAFVASKSHVDTAVEENLTLSGQAKHLPWVTMGGAVVAGLALSRFVRWASRGSVVPTTAPPEPPKIVPVMSYAPPPVAVVPEAPRAAQRPAPPPPRRKPPPPPRPLFGELGTALRGLGESALSSVLSLGARTLGEKLLAQVFEGGLPGTTAQAGHHDRHRNGSHPSASF
jgi:hypothetical protein